MAISKRWKCRLVDQGYAMGKCGTRMPDGSIKSACKATLKKKNGEWFRVICSAHLSRPEHYFSIYMSGCSFACRKCHSHEFTKCFKGTWMSTREIAKLCAEYAEEVTYKEARERALNWYATDLCRGCGACVLEGTRSDLCPGVLSREQVIFSPQGFGPARNLIGYTGGDLACCSEFYVQLTEAIKSACEDMFVLFETNGYGLTPANLEAYESAGVDSFWLDIKAYDADVHKRLCGVSNARILELPAEILDRGFMLEVLSLYIPGWVEGDQLVKIAELLVEADPEIPFTLLAFFPEYKLIDNRPPTTMEMVRTYLALKDAGLKRIKIGNCGVFAHTRKDWNLLLATVGPTGIG